MGLKQTYTSTSSRADTNDTQMSDIAIEGTNASMQTESRSTNRRSEGDSLAKESIALLLQHGHGLEPFIAESVVESTWDDSRMTTEAGRREIAKELAARSRLAHVDGPDVVGHMH